MRIVICALCFFGATSCSGDDDSSTEAGMLQPMAGAAGAASGAIAGSSGAGGGAATAGAAPDTGMDGPSSGETPAEEALSFEADVLPILSENCGPCHTGSGVAGHDVGGELPGAYNDAMRLGETLLERIGGEGATGGMPPGCLEPGTDPCLSVAEVQTVADWIEQGSLP
jgi:hypothetical protein